MKNFICWILCLSLLFSVLPLGAFAEEDSYTEFLDSLQSKYTHTADGEKTVFKDLSYEQSGYIYEKYEITFNLNLSYTNPFDPEDISVNGIFTFENGETAVVPAFYMEEMLYNKLDTTLMTYNANSYIDLDKKYWCVRFSGENAGVYSFYLEATIADGGIYRSEAYTFELMHSENNGFIDISKENPEYFVDTADNSLFYGSGSNIAWVRSQFTTNPDHLSYEYFINQAAENTSLTRVWLCHWAWLEWMPDMDTSATYSYAGLGYYNQCISSALDNIFSMCEDRGLRIILTLDDNDEHKTASNSDGSPTYDSWGFNPYNAENGGPALDTDDYWGNEEVRKYYKNRLRYIIARWGYSTSLMSLNLWNDYTTPSDATTDYLKELNDYTKAATENYRPLLFSSNFKYEATESLDYSTQNTANGNRLSTKPVITQECYYSSDDNYFKITLKNTIWEELFSFSAATMVWDHDTVDETESWGLFKGLLNFTKKLSLHKSTYLSHYNVNSFATTWNVNDSDGNPIRPELSIENGELVFTTSELVTSNVTIITENPSFSAEAGGISFRYDATEFNSKSSMRLNLACTANGETHNYMPWYGGTYYFTPDGEETQALTVSGRNQWSSFLTVFGGKSGTYYLPFEIFNVPQAHIDDTDVSAKYKFDIFEDAGQSFVLSFQQQPTAEAAGSIKIDDIYWAGDNYQKVIQDFSAYTATSPISAEYSESDTESFKNITAKALGDVAGWAQTATENQFTVNETDSDLLFAGISSKLYGTNSGVINYRNDPTFTVNCTFGGTMVVELTEIGSGTNRLTFTKNGEILNQTVLTGGRRYVTEEERYIAVELEPGTNVITLSNEGNDWIGIAGYHFKFFTENDKECVSIKRMISEKQQTALVQNSKNGEIYQKVFEGTPNAALNVTVPFYDLKNKEYRFEVYNTESGLLEACEIITVTDNRFTATLSRIDDSVALKLTEFAYGDSNQDGQLNIIDVVRLKKYVAGIRTDVSYDNSDTDLNGTIEISDIALLRNTFLE